MGLHPVSVGTGMNLRNGNRLFQSFFPFGPWIVLYQSCHFSLGQFGPILRVDCFGIIFYTVLMDNKSVSRLNLYSMMVSIDLFHP